MYLKRRLIVYKLEFGIKVTRTLGNQRILMFFLKPKICEMRSILSKVANSAYKSIAAPHTSHRFLGLQSVVIPNSGYKELYVYC